VLTHIHPFNVTINFIFFECVNGLHSSLQKTSNKSAHVLNWTLNEEFLDEILVTHGFEQPYAYSNILLESTSDHLDKVWNQLSVRCSKGYSETERDQEFQDLSLVLNTV
jgi:hypothetical protein